MLALLGHNSDSLHFDEYKERKEFDSMISINQTCLMVIGFLTYEASYYYLQLDNGCQKIAYLY